jgi:hypothetical protein
LGRFLVRRREFRMCRRRRRQVVRKAVDRGCRRIGHRPGFLVRSPAVDPSRGQANEVTARVELSPLLFAYEAQNSRSLKELRRPRLVRKPRFGVRGVCGAALMAVCGLHRGIPRDGTLHAQAAINFNTAARPVDRPCADLGRFFWRRPVLCAIPPRFSFEKCWHCDDVAIRTRIGKIPVCG